MRGELGYLDLIRKILQDGTRSEDRTGTGTWSLFGEQLSFDVSNTFPLLTTKRVHYQSVLRELLWMISGDTNVRALQAQGVTIWDEWADEEGDLGPVYGAQWRWAFGGVHDMREEGVDQLADLVKNLKENPYSRRHLVTAWNPVDLPYQSLPPCHYAFQCYVRGDVLSLNCVMRSVDVFLGLPFNIAGYATLLRMLAHVCGYQPGELVMQLGDTHIYTNHINQCHLQLSRSPMIRPCLDIASDAPRDLFALRAGHFKVRGYVPHPSISAEVSV